MELKKRHALLLLILAAGSQISSLPVITPRRRQRFVWVKDWLLRRDEKGAMNNISQSYDWKVRKITESI